MKNYTNNKFRFQSILIGLIAGIIVALIFLLGFLVGIYSSTITAQNTPTVDAGGEYAILAEVDHLISHTFLRELPDANIREYGAIRGMLETLADPATFFIDPPVAQSESQVLAGTYGGIGVQVKRIESGQIALFPFDQGPAHEAGIRDNDILLKVNGDDLASDVQLDIVDQLLRGEVINNNGVELTVLRDDKIVESGHIAFDVINVPSVISRIIDEDNRLGYIQILRFTSRTPSELQEQIKLLQDSNIQGIILDLRDNSGGLLVESIQVADEFLEDGIIVIEKSRDNEEIHSATNNGSLLELPLVVLINGRTASASELVAGALQDNKRATLIGQKSFGKGTVQQIFPLSDGSSVHITSAEWLTPNQNAINGNGLYPDIEMIPDENARDIEFGEAVNYIQNILDRNQN